MCGDRMKQLKRFLLVILCLAMCVSLCACSELDEMRAHQAFMQEDGTLLWGGEVYKSLPSFERELMLSFDYEFDAINITDLDVPVFLSNRIRKTVAYSYGDGLLLEDINQWTGGYYCREDRYEEFLAAVLMEAPMTKCYFEYYDENHNEVYYILSDEEMATIEAAFEASTVVNSRDVDAFRALSLFRCTEDEFFREYYITIEYGDDTYYLNEHLGNETAFHEVPEEYHSTFAKFVAYDQYAYYLIE